MDFVSYDLFEENGSKNSHPPSGVLNPGPLYWYGSLSDNPCGERKKSIQIEKATIILDKEIKDDRALSAQINPV
ncbi:MAG: hypothetical protein K0R08_1417 [Solimicrobium sp.]|jgi:hypothetical protein|nr:hypothetical protein [Solimicrobium sp.]